MTGAKKKWDGLCFDSVFHAALEGCGNPEFQGPGVRYVHGWVTSGGRRLLHAWVENDWGVLDLTEERVYRRGNYYQVLQIKESEVVRYTEAQLLGLAVRHKNKGPWDKKFDEEGVLSMTKFTKKIEAKTSGDIHFDELRKLYLKDSKEGVIIERKLQTLDNLEQPGQNALEQMELDTVQKLEDYQDDEIKNIEPLKKEFPKLHKALVEYINSFTVSLQVSEKLGKVFEKELEKAQETLEKQLEKLLHDTRKAKLNPTQKKRKAAAPRDYKK